MTSTRGFQTKPKALENIVAIPSQLWGGTASGVGWPGETRANPSTVSGFFFVPAMLPCCHDVMLNCEFERIGKKYSRKIGSGLRSVFWAQAKQIRWYSPFSEGENLTTRDDWNPWELFFGQGYLFPGGKQALGGPITLAKNKLPVYSQEKWDRYFGLVKAYWSRVTGLRGGTMNSWVVFWGREVEGPVDAQTQEMRGNLGEPHVR